MPTTELKQIIKDNDMSSERVVGDGDRTTIHRRLYKEGVVELSVLAPPSEYLYTHQNGIMFRKADASDLQELINLKNESWFGTHRISIINSVNQTKWLEELSNQDIHAPKDIVLIAATANPIVNSGKTSNIGVFKILNICWQSRLANVGWDIYKGYRGKGFGKNLVKAGVDFCFKAINLHRLSAEILVGNTASHICAEAAGFKKEGLQAKAIWRNEKWVDNVLYGIVNE